MGALIAFCLAYNRERGAFCGGLIASRLLAMHGLAPHYLDVQLPIERLDFNSMIRHNFISNWTALCRDPGLAVRNTLIMLNTTIP